MIAVIRYATNALDRRRSTALRALTMRRRIYTESVNAHRSIKELTARSTFRNFTRTIATTCVALQAARVQRQTTVTPVAKTQFLIATDTATANSASMVHTVKYLPTISERFTTTNAVPSAMDVGDLKLPIVLSALNMLRKMPSLHVSVMPCGLEMTVVLELLTTQDYAVQSVWKVLVVMVRVMVIAFVASTTRM